MLKKFYLQYTSITTEIPEILNHSYLPSLNGLRGISIIFVIVSHIVYKTRFQWLHVFFSGKIGVHIFFVISGFLITTLLMKEKILNGSFSLRRFWIRRALRILPVAYLYVIVIFIFDYIFKLNVPLFEFLGSVLFINNLFSVGDMSFFGHYWSLAVEEQFYIFFPLFLKKNQFVYNLILPLVILSLHILLFITNRIDALNFPAFQMSVNFLFVFEGIMTGSFVAILFFKNLIPFAFIKKYKIIINIIAAIMLFIINSYGIPVLRHAGSFFIALILISNLYPAEDSIFIFLNNKILVKTGILSYSLYIWQQPFAWMHASPEYKNIGWLQFPVNVILLIITAYLSYNYYEKYFLELRDKYKKV